MPTVSISKAIKLSGVSRQHFYDAYLKTGKISVDRSDEKRPVIDTSEILRVFGKLHEDNPPSDTEKDRKDTLENLEMQTLRFEIEKMRLEMGGLKSLVQEKDTRIQEKDRELERYRERINGLEVRYDRLLETAQAKSQPTGLWGKIRAAFSG